MVHGVVAKQKYVNYELFKIQYESKTFKEADDYFDNTPSL